MKKIKMSGIIPSQLYYNEVWKRKKKACHNLIHVGSYNLHCYEMNVLVGSETSNGKFQKEILISADVEDTQ